MPNDFYGGQAVCPYFIAVEGKRISCMSPVPRARIRFDFRDTASLDRHFNTRCAGFDYEFCPLVSGRTGDEEPYEEP